MDALDQLHLTHVLREREAAFVTVWECEDRIRRLLRGAAFPFPAPPDLPSRRRRASVPAAAKSGVGAGLRRRRRGEDAYRLSCLNRGEPGEALTDELDTVRALLAAPPQVLSVLRVETVALDDAGKPTVLDCLWSAPTPTLPPRPPTGADSAGPPQQL